MRWIFFILNGSIMKWSNKVESGVSFMGGAIYQPVEADQSRQRVANPL